MRVVRETLPRIADPYQKAYYTGIASERSGQALLHRGGMGSGAMAYDALRDAMSTAFAKLGSLILMSILGGLAVGLGMLACCVPGIYIYVSILFASQIIVAEGTTGFDAFSRSNQLVDGHRWRVLGIALVIQVVSGVLTQMIALPFFALEVAQYPGTPPGSHPQYQIMSALIQMPFVVVFTAFQAVCFTLMYLDLRIRKEGFDLAVMAQDAARRGEAR